jgi:8-oxo-dGTP pyrophosphatase MutT (NUDIX family)
LINEIYGGVLPYSASIESIKEQMKDNHQKRTTHHQVVKKDKAEERVRHFPLHFLFHLFQNSYNPHSHHNHHQFHLHLHPHRYHLTLNYHWKRHCHQFLNWFDLFQSLQFVLKREINPVRRRKLITMCS